MRDTGPSDCESLPELFAASCNTHRQFDHVLSVYGAEGSAGASSRRRLPGREPLALPQAICGTGWPQGERREGQTERWARELALPGPPADQLTSVAMRLQFAGMMTRFDVVEPSSLVT